MFKKKTAQETPEKAPKTTQAPKATKTEAVASPKPKKSRKKWIVGGIVLIILLGLGGTGYVLARRMQGPAIGTIVVSAPDMTKQSQVQQQQFDGTNFSFVHPITYIEQTVKPQPGNTDLEDHTFLSTVMNGGVLVMSVTKFPSGNLNDDSSYTMRMQNPNKYQRKAVMVQNEQVVIFTSNDGQQLQQTAYWPHAGKLLTFAMTGVATDTQSASSEFLSMVESLTWH